MGTKKRTKKSMKKTFNYETADMVNGLNFPIFELPTNLVYEIISRLPLKTIFSCRCVCKTFLKIIEDPYFSKTHLTSALSRSTTIIVKENHVSSGYFRPYMLDIDYTPQKSSCSSDYRTYHQHIISRQSDGVTQRDVKCCFLRGDATLISSCNGLLCLYSTASLQKPMYCICNPVSGECISLPPPASLSSKDTYLNHSGFGFCPKAKQYKVIRFMKCSTLRTVALVHTLGTRSWRNIGDAPHPKPQGSFDSFLDGRLHWIIDKHKMSDTICSFDLETEKFEPVPLPTHFSPEYLKKISWICVGVIGRCLCLCYISDNAHFEVYAMNQYGVQESWTKKFVIYIKFYCGLEVQDLQKPIKFLNNGELLLLSKFNTLVSYSPEKGTFRDIKRLGNGRAEAIAHVPSFVALQTDVFGRCMKAERIKLQTAKNVHDPLAPVTVG